MLMKILNILSLAFLSSFCSKAGDGSGGGQNPCLFLGVDTCAANAPQTVTIRLQDKRQVIHSFGASDCWTAKYIGNWANEAKKNQAADYLFSMDTAQDGTPKGIGLALALQHRVREFRTGRRKQHHGRMAAGRMLPVGRREL